MPLEDLTGSQLIEDLNPDWPDGSTDFVSSVDDHVRGIKNVLQNQFPNLEAPVTRTAAQLNAASIPSGSVTVFYQKAAPTGWTRQTVGKTQMLRVVPTTGTEKDLGGTFAGIHEPANNDYVAPHTHGYSNLVVESYYHQHNLNITASGTHTHTIPFSGTGANLGSGPASTYQAGTGNSTGAGGDHSHAGSYTDGDNHTHVVSGTLDNNTGPKATGWQPRYLNVILCSKN